MMANPVKSVQDPCAGNGQCLLVSIMEMTEHETAIGRAALVVAEVLDAQNNAREHVLPIPPLVNLRKEMASLLRSIYGATTDVLFA